MNKKIKILSYECIKCNKTVYFRSDEEYSTQCKTCKNKMKFAGEFNYNPKGGLSAIKNCNFNKKVNKDNIEKNVPKCPTCNSENIEKIGVGERVVSVVTLGLFSNKINKTFKCKNCGYIW